MKIIAVASQGGHWIQLQRLVPSLYKDDVVTDLKYVTTKSIKVSSYRGEFLISEQVSDCNLKDFFGLAKSFSQCFKIALKFKPDVVISTGAAPGLIMIIVARLFGAKTIWIDSIANTKELSLSGKAAKYICSHTFTQWPDLVDKRVKYIGSVI